MPDPEVIEAEPQPATGLAIRERQRSSVLLMPVMDVNTAMARLKEFQEFCGKYLEESKDGGNDGGDYGIIPGTKKKTLFKSGADKLCEVYGLYDQYKFVSKVEDWELGLFDYAIECTLLSRRDDSVVGTGLGSCSSFESKYRWRDAKRTCPQCHQAAIIKGKEEYGGGWLCWAKNGGCGSKFADTDPAIVGQVLGRVENPDIIDIKNTVLKIAKKRAKVDAVIGATRSSGIFTQDLDDLAHGRPAAEQANDDAGKPLTTAEAPKAAPQTQAEKVAAVKAAQSANAAKTPAPAAVAEQITPAAAAPATAAPSAAPTPAATAPAAGPAGVVLVSGLNVKSGVTDNKKWTLYIMTFNGKVKASDGNLVDNASTLEESIALQAENCRNAKTPVIPVIVPGKKKGSYNLTALDLPADR